jgi:hypothetical protein
VEAADHGIALNALRVASFPFGFNRFSSHGAAFQSRLMHNSAFQLAAFPGEFS